MIKSKEYQSNIDNIELNKGKKPPALFVLLIALFGIFAYFTGISFVASVDNNIGLFEMVAMVIFIVTFVYFLSNRLSVKSHFTITMLILIVVAAVFSLPNLADRIDWGLIQLLLLVYNAFLVLILFNLMFQFPSLIHQLLRFAVLGAFISGVWVAQEGIFSNASIGTAGPFRSRAHVGIYMVTSFWITILYFFWPGIHKFERIGAIPVIIVTLYGVAVSGRRSVYVSLFIGLALLSLSFIFLHGTGRFQISIAVAIAIGILIFFAQIGSQYVPQLDFFNNRIGLIDERLELATGTDESVEDDDNFILLQRDGMLRALADHPFLGIGWGGFFDSEYSPTGHEMHSTPQRFLAELGIVGFVLYMGYNMYLWFGSIRLFFRIRGTKYQMPALVFMVAIWSLSISWAYNRSITERTYWILIILFVSFDTLVNQQLASLNKKGFKRINRSGYYSEPERPHTPPVMPFSRK